MVATYPGLQRAAHTTDLLLSCLGCTHPGHDASGPLATEACDWLLHPVAAGPADEQYLFELCVRLKYTGDDRVAVPALLELTQCCAADFAAEVLVAKKQEILVGQWVYPLCALLCHFHVECTLFVRDYLARLAMLHLCSLSNDYMLGAGSEFLRYYSELMQHGQSTWQHQVYPGIYKCRTCTKTHAARSVCIMHNFMPHGPRFA